MRQFFGTGVALITPFDSDNQVDYPALEQLVNFQIEKGIDYLVVLGTTAETPTLSGDEQQKIVDFIVRVNDKRLPVVLGVGGNNTMAVVKNIQKVNSDKIDAILSVSPYYNKPSQEGIYQHFKAIAEESPLPIILYNVPSRTGSNMATETVMRLANDFDNIIGIKEAAGDFEQVLELIRTKPNDFMVISGEDKLALPLVLAGGAGVISVLGQGFPKQFSKMIHLGLEGKVKKAYDLFYKLSPAIDLIFEEGNPVGIKSLLNTLQICSGHIRLPLVKASGDLQQKLITFVQNFK
jgi:4-hydroxy-tetrahydrodipicolinate synthase